MSISLFLLLGCEKELYEDSIKNNERSITIKETTLKELLKNPIFNTAYSKVKSKTLELKNTNARTALEDQYNFTITDDDVLVMETNDSIKSYTFLIERETVTTDYFENLVIQIDSSGDIDALIMKYTPSSPDLTNFEGTKEVTPLVQSGRVYYFSNGCVMTTWTTCSYLVNNSNHPEWASVHIAGAGCNNPNYFNYYSSIVCPNENGGGGGDPTPTPTDDDPTIDGGSGGSVITNPNPPNNAVSKNFIKNLTTPGSPNYDPTRHSCYANSSPDFKAAMTAFLDGNSPELSEDDETIAGIQNAKNQFVNAAIDAQCSGAEVDFDNGVILDSSFLLNAKAICVYNKLKTSSTFKNIFANVFEVTNKPFIILKTANLPGNAYNGVVGNCKPTNGSVLLNTITIDTDLIADGHPLQIAKTIAHEFIHAFLNIKLFNPSLGMTIPALSDMAFNQVVNAYYNNFSAGQNQHNFMYNYLIPTLQSILSEIKDLCVDSLNNAEMLNLSMRIPYDTSPPSPFIWNEYYKNLALAGLQDCSFFQAEIGTFNTNGNPTVIDQTKMQSYNQYNQRGLENLIKNCN